MTSSGERKKILSGFVNETERTIAQWHSIEDICQTTHDLEIVLHEEITYLQTLVDSVATALQDVVQRAADLEQNHEIIVSSVGAIASRQEEITALVEAEIQGTDNEHALTAVAAYHEAGDNHLNMTDSYTDLRQHLGQTVSKMNDLTHLMNAAVTQSDNLKETYNKKVDESVAVGQELATACESLMAYIAEI